MSLTAAALNQLVDRLREMYVRIADLEAELEALKAPKTPPARPQRRPIETRPDGYLGEPGE